MYPWAYWPLAGAAFAIGAAGLAIRARGSATPLGLGIDVVKTMVECLDVVTQIDPNRPRERPRVRDRVMRFLHLKDPATV